MTETILDRVLADDRLSLRARGVAAYALRGGRTYLPPSHEMMEHCREGRDAIRAAARELERYGYIGRRRYRDKNGAWRSDVFFG